MNTLKYLGRRGAVLAAAAIAASVLSSGAWAASSQETVTVRAASLQAEADRHAERAAYYRERAVLGSKQLITYFTLANHCEQEANRYRVAALGAGGTG